LRRKKVYCLNKTQFKKKGLWVNCRDCKKKSTLPWKENKLIEEKYPNGELARLRRKAH